MKTASPRQAISGFLPIGYQRGLQFGYRNPKDPDRGTPSQNAEAVAHAFPHDLKRSSDAPDAAWLCRKLPAAQPDRSVTIATVGFLANLRNLLDSRPDEHNPLDGEALVKQKVRPRTQRVDPHPAEGAPLPRRVHAAAKGWAQSLRA